MRELTSLTVNLDGIIDLLIHNLPIGAKVDVETAWRNSLQSLQLLPLQIFRREQRERILDTILGDMLDAKFVDNGTKAFYQRSGMSLIVKMMASPNASSKLVCTLRYFGRLRLTFFIRQLIPDRF
jgi:hypothetical protein